MSEDKLDLLDTTRKELSEGDEVEHSLKQITEKLERGNQDNMCFAIDIFSKEIYKAECFLDNVEAIDAKQVRRIRKLLEVVMSYNNKRQQLIKERINRYREVFTLVLKSMDKLCNNATDSSWPSRKDIEIRLDITYKEYLKSVDSFLGGADASQHDNFINLLCACIFKDKDKAREYSKDVNQTLLKCTQLISANNDNLKGSSTNSNWPSRKEIEARLGITKEIYLLVVDIFLKEVDTDKKSDFIHYLCACIFQDNSKANTCFSRISLSTGPDVMRALNNKINIQKNKK